MIYGYVMNDERAGPAIEALKKRGLPDDALVPLICHIAVLPRIWKDWTVERPIARNHRRAELAYEIQRLARRIEADPEAKHYRVVDHQSVTTSMKGYPTVAEYLAGFAELVLGHKGGA